MARYVRAYGDSDLKRAQKKAEREKAEREEQERLRDEALARRTTGGSALADRMAQILAKRTGSASQRLDPDTLLRRRAQEKDLADRTGVHDRSPLEDLPDASHEEYEKAEVKVAYTAIEEARHQARKKQREKEKRDFLDATDGDYWILVCFCTRAQREAFLDAMGWKEEHFVEGTYVDGVALAKDLKIKLPETSLRFYGTKEDRRLVEEVGTIPRTRRKP